MARPTDHPAGADSFEAYARRTRPSLVRLAHLIAGSPEWNEEAAQEALAAVHARWDHLDDPDAYGRRVLVNQIRTQQRRAVRERRFLARRVVEPVTGEPELDELWVLVRRLKPTQRAVVVLRYYADLTPNEIATELGIPVGTVKSTLHRALARLKETVRV